MSKTTNKQPEWITERIVTVAEQSCKHARKVLKDGSATRIEEDVDAAREDLKRIRSIFRLVKVEMKDYKKLNTFYRDEARKMVPLQIANAMVNTVDMIHEQYSERLYKNAFTQLRSQLVEHKQEKKDEALKKGHILQEIAQNLGEHCEQLQEHLKFKNAYTTLGSGLKKVYGKAKKAQEKLNDKVDAEHLHELQKRTSYLNYQLDILKPIWPQMISAWMQELDRLNSLLVANEGLHHLSRFLDTNPDQNHAEDGAYLMKTLIEGHSEQLQKHALLLAQKLFYFNPKDFVSYFETSWNVYNTQQEQQLLPLEKLGFK